MASIIPTIFAPDGPGSGSLGYKPIFPNYSNKNATAIFKNGHAVIVPGTTTNSYIFGPGDYIAPLNETISWAYAFNVPTDRSPFNFNAGDIYVDTHVQFYNPSAVGNPNPSLWQYQTDNTFKPIGTLLSAPTTQLSTAVTLNGGTSADIQAAIISAGANGEIILMGSFTCNAWIRNFSNYSVTLRFENPTLNFGQAPGTPTIGVTTRIGGTMNRLVPSANNFQTAVETSSIGI